MLSRTMKQRPQLRNLKREAVQTLQSLRRLFCGTVRKRSSAGLPCHREQPFAFHSIPLQLSRFAIVDFQPIGKRLEVVPIIQAAGAQHSAWQSYGTKGALTDPEVTRSLGS